MKTKNITEKYGAKVTFFKSRLSQFGYFLAKSSPGGKIVRMVFAHMSFVLPVQRLRETPSLIAFRHPAPSYPFHVLIVPKRNLPSLEDLSESDIDFITDLVQTVQSLEKEFELKKTGYRLIVNGGNYQEVSQVHFHLISDG